MGTLLARAAVSFRLNVVVGDFTFNGADGVLGFDILSSFKSVKFDFRKSMLVLDDK